MLSTTYLSHIALSSHTNCKRLDAPDKYKAKL